MNLLGLLYGRQGRDTDAEPLLLQALELTERTLGAEHESTLIALDNLADLRTRQKRFDEAERLYRRELEVYRRIEGEEHFQTATVISKLAALYSRQRRFDEAEPLCLKAVEIRRRLLGENHPRTLYALNTLAVLYRQQAALRRGRTAASTGAGGQAPRAGGRTSGHAGFDEQPRESLRRASAGLRRRSRSSWRR